MNNHSKKYLIVSRHTALVEWLKAKGIEGEVIPHATPEQIAGQTVIGILPVNLASLCARYGNVGLPKLSADLRGKELTVEQMDEAGATLEWYTVTRVA